MRGKGSSRRRPRLGFFLTLPERARRARAVSGRCGEGREGEGERSSVDGRMNVSIRARRVDGVERGERVHFLFWPEKWGGLSRGRLRLFAVGRYGKGWLGGGGREIIEISTSNKERYMSAR